MDKIIAERQSASILPFNSFAEYAGALMTALFSDIDVKAGAYKKPMLSTLFQLNNLHYIQKSIKGTKLAMLIGNTLVEQLETQIKNNMNVYRSR